MERHMERPVEKFLIAGIKWTGSLTAALGLVLIIGFGVAGVTGWIFTELAETVQAGATLALDESVLRWMQLHQSPLATTAALEMTALGTGTVVIMMTVVAGMFLALTEQRKAALLLVAATIGGLALNLLLKLHYHRPRPHVFPWATNVVSSSFPSGHAMNAVIVYGTIAYLAARLSRRLSVRVTTQLLAVVVIVAICASRVYLGVHYPSDVLGGAIIGAAWAMFCMAALESVQRIRGMRSAARAVRSPTAEPQTDSPPPESPARSPRA
jgi:undecaprenyl-diphosphatase